MIGHISTTTCQPLIFPKVWLYRRENCTQNCQLVKHQFLVDLCKNTESFSCHPDVSVGIGVGLGVSIGMGVGLVSHNKVL